MTSQAYSSKSARASVLFAMDSRAFRLTMASSEGLFANPLSSCSEAASIISEEVRLQLPVVRYRLESKGIPTSVHTSATSLVLMRLSKGEPDEREGHMLTSSNHGLIS